MILLACLLGLALAVDLVPPAHAAASLVAAGPQAQGGTASGDVAELARRAKEAMADGRFGEAAGLYERMLEAYPAEAGLHMNLGMARVLAGEPRAALPALQRAIELDGSLLPAHLFLGGTYLDLGEPERAVAPLEKVLAAVPDHSQALQALGEALLALERNEDAARRFEDLTKAMPESPRTWAGLGRSYEGAARNSFAELQALAPNSPYVSLLVAEVFVVERKLPEAFALYREAQAALPNLPGMHEAIAEVYEKAGHADWAATERARARDEPRDCARAQAACAFFEEDFRHTLELTKDASTPGGWYWRTRAFNQLATEAFGKLEQLPPSVELHAVRARVAADQNRPQEAVDELRAALELAPGDPALQRELALALYRARDHEAMLPIAEKLVAESPDEPELLFLYGSGLLAAQHVDRAIRPLERAVAAQPSFIEARAALGRALMLKGDAAAAVPHLEAALPTDEDGSLYYQLAQAYQRTDRAAEARAALEKYQSIKQQASAATETSRSSPPPITPPN